jgi:hypothetical protein
MIVKLVIHRFDQKQDIYLGIYHRSHFLKAHDTFPKALSVIGSIMCFRVWLPIQNAVVFRASVFAAYVMDRFEEWLLPFAHLPE